MSKDFDPSELHEHVAPEEEAVFAELGQTMRVQRPNPEPRFRGDLRRHLLRDGMPQPRPRRLRLLIAVYATSGCALMLLGALSVAGVGPLAP